MWLNNMLETELQDECSVLASYFLWARLFLSDDFLPYVLLVTQVVLVGDTR